MFLQQLGEIQVIGNISGTCFSKIVNIIICLCSVICFAVPLGVLTEGEVWGNVVVCDTSIVWFICRALWHTCTSA